MVVSIFIIFSIILKLFIDFYYGKLEKNKKYILYTCIQIISVLSFFIVSQKCGMDLAIYDYVMIGTAILSFFFFLFYWDVFKKNLQEKWKMKLISILLCSTVISVCFETFICNFKFFQTLGYKPDIVESNQMIMNEDEEATNAVLEINSINKKVNNLYLELNYPSNYVVQIEATDEGNKYYYSLPEREIHNNIEKSKYLTLYLSGKSEKLKLNFSFDKDQLIVNKIVLNNPVPFLFSSVRVCLIIFILLFVFFFQSNSFLYKIKLSEVKKKNLLILLLITIQIVSFCVIGKQPLFHSQDVGYEDSNNLLAESLIHGKTYIEDVNHTEEILNTIENPYDINLRNIVFAQKSEHLYLWDRAFYKGHYYIYFGVIPIVFFYVPYHILFHAELPTMLLTFLIATMTSVLITLFFYQFVKKYYSTCSVGVFILLDLLLVYGSGLLLFVTTPDMYTLPVATAYLFTIIGLFLWTSILKSDRLIPLKIFFGSFCMACVAGCRPQLIMGSFLIIPIALAFYQENKEKLNKKKILFLILSVMIPYVIVAIPLMYYNYVRFGSVFDFGANYNLTTNDMTVRGFVLERIPLGIVTYLFQPMSFQNVFPYITKSSLVTNYLGLTIYEPISGGLFLTMPIYLLSLFLPKFKKIIQNKYLYIASWIMIVSAFIIVIVNTEMAGLLERYLVDFTWLFAFVTIIILLSIEKKKFKYKEVFHKILFIMICCALIYQFFYLFVDAYDHFKFYNSHFWLYMKYLIEFWI